MLALTVFTSDRLSTIGPLLALGVFLAVAHQKVLRWRSLLVLVVLVILFIPMKRYSLPASLPINLEPYRLLVFFVALAWLTSLLIDPRVRFRRTPLDGPLMVFALVALLSDIVEPRACRLGARGGRQEAALLPHLLPRLLRDGERRQEGSRTSSSSRECSWSAAPILGFLALVERNTGYDVFNHLQSVIPFLHLDATQIPHLSRGGRLRVYGSAQHPIALGAALAMIVPFAIFLTRRRGGKLWWVAAALLALGSLATGSRTSIMMFGAIALVYLLLRPSKVLRMWPALLPALLAIHFAVPGSLGTIRSSFFPKGGLIAQQTNASVGSGRLATLGPALRREFDPNPLLGEGFGTRVTVKTPLVPVPNAPILDDQWLGILCETGLARCAHAPLAFLRFMRRLWPDARDDDSPRSWYLARRNRERRLASQRRCSSTTRSRSSR